MNNKLTKFIGETTSNLLHPPNAAFMVKRPCRYCDNEVTMKDGLQCKGACSRWAHYKCLGFTPQMMIDARAGKLEVMCPCPHCKYKMYDEDVHKEYRCIPVDGVCPQTPVETQRFNKVSACEDPPQWLIDLDKCDVETCDPPCRSRKIAGLEDRRANAAAGPANTSRTSLSRKQSATGAGKVRSRISFHDTTEVRETLRPTEMPPQSPSRVASYAGKPVNETAVNVEQTTPALACDRPEPCGAFSTCGRAPPCDGLAPCGKYDYPCSKRKELLVKRPYKYKNYKYKAETTKCVKPFLSRTPSKVSIKTEASRGLICDSPTCRDAACLPHSTCGTSPIFKEPVPPSDQFCNREFKAPPLVLGYHPRPEVSRKTEPVVGLLPEDAPCRNCRCIIGPTMADFKCVSKMCPVRYPNDLKSSKTCDDNRNKSCTCLTVSVDPYFKSLASLRASDSTLTRPGQRSLRLAIDQLTTTVGQLSAQIKRLIGSGSSTSNKSKRTSFNI